MAPLLKLGRDGFGPRGHPPLLRNPPDDESSIAVALPAVVSETQERERPPVFRLSLSPEVRGCPQSFSALPTQEPGES
jgi:hypothetical protein